MTKQVLGKMTKQVLSRTQSCAASWTSSSQRSSSSPSSCTTCHIGKSSGSSPCGRWLRMHAHGNGQRSAMCGQVAMAGAQARADCGGGGVPDDPAVHRPAGGQSSLDALADPPVFCRVDDPALLDRAALPKRCGEGGRNVGVSRRQSRPTTAAHAWRHTWWVVGSWGGVVGLWGCGAVGWPCLPWRTSCSSRSASEPFSKTTCQSSPFVATTSPLVTTSADGTMSCSAKEMISPVWSASIVPSL